VTRGVFPVLLALKLRLLLRTFTRKGGLQAALMMVVMAVVFAPFWLGFTSVAYFGATRFGAPAVLAGFGIIHLGWVAGSLLLGSFAEGFDLRLLLRYPVPPRTAFWLNVLVAPFEFTALFLLPPLGALAWGSGIRAGWPAGLLVAAAGLALLLITSALTQMLIALLGRFLRREWTRAIFGLLLGLIFAVPALTLRGAVGVRGADALAQIEGPLQLAAGIFQWLPTTALSARTAGAALAGQPLLAVAWLLATAAFLALFVRICAGVALAEALNREAPATREDVGPLTGHTLESRLEALLPTDLALLIARELRTYLRTPQLLIGLLTSPLVILLLTHDKSLGSDTGAFFVAFASLVTALNLSSNQFGLDQAGVRLLFLLPVPARRLLLAKNLAVAGVTVFGALVGLSVSRAVGGALDALDAITALATLAAALPVVLAFGNRLSIAHPWRMTFRMGGAPPGVMLSALAQMVAIGAVGVALAPGLLLLPGIYGHSLLIRLASLGITAAMAAVLWFLWSLFLTTSARELDRKHEFLIDRLAKPGETG
jgi:ABC-2 type transport system permease protein